MGRDNRLGSVNPGRCPGLLCFALAGRFYSIDLLVFHGNLMEPNTPLIISRIKPVCKAKRQKVFCDLADYFSVEMWPLKKTASQTVGFFVEVEATRCF